MHEIVRVTWLLALGAVAIAVAVAAGRLLGPDEGATWTTFAAALAVVSSLITARTGQRVLEIQQAAQRPYPYPFIDASSRYQLLQLRVANFGGTAAHDIRLEWKNRPLDFQNRPVSFTSQSGAPEIAVLLPGQSVATPIDSDAGFFGKHEDANYTGRVFFKDASGKSLHHDFYVSAGQYRLSSSYAEEEPKTHFELQKIPKQLEELRHAIDRLQNKEG